ncbi:DMT family transporter [Leptothoe sp. LEGE 181152]|uniref:DMT family transporter n=1 Tax=Adonisia turfae CCMR0081 TaxID=2292702 RepID=A0A6M0RF08_9CYAN|nr:DMT family transporter [Adonisia turfae]MDV3348693.1 DMT family transporter [Leptothoe sp. LEGE 181152]NEZ54490.1 DMT family transporter [Adonisia turfae CCMR0081]
MKLSNILELLLLAALWGGSFLFMRIAAPVLGPVWLIEFRVLLAGLVLLPVLARLRLMGTMRRQLMPLLIVGCLNSAIPFLLLAFASVSLPAGFTSILNGTAPLFGTVVASVWLSERLTPSRKVGFVLGFIGVVILVGWKAVDTTPSFLVAVVAALSAALMYAIAAPYIKKNLAGVPSLVVTTGSQLGAALVIIPALPFTIPQQVPSAGVAIAVLALAVLSTAFAYILYFRLIQNIGSTKALTVTYLIPMFAMLWGAIVLQEAVTSSMILGCGLVLLGTAIANDLFPTTH